MANYKSAASQAIKDMLEMGINVTFFTGNINKIHELNVVIGIISKEKASKKPKKEEHFYYEPKTKPQPKKIVMKQSCVINPDGTVALGIEWDFD